MLMIDVSKNKKINEELSNLYNEYSAACLKTYIEIFHDPEPPCRINEFGIVDETRYDTDNGIFFIAKETNNWSNQEFENEYFFRGWINRMSQEGVRWHEHIKRHPNMWYNMGRWAMYLSNPEYELSYIRSCTDEAVFQLGTVAYTNINKVRGHSSSGKEYWDMANSPITGEILRKELDIIKPKTVVCCGTYRVFCHHIPDYHGVLIDMPHPGAYKSALSMLENICEQYLKQV